MPTQSHEDTLELPHIDAPERRRYAWTGKPSEWLAALSIFLIVCSIVMAGISVSNRIASSEEYTKNWREGIAGRVSILENYQKATEKFQKDTDLRLQGIDDKLKILVDRK